MLASLSSLESSFPEGRAKGKNITRKDVGTKTRREAKKLAQSLVQVKE